ncbi:hypothetical protein BDF20DRAFT_1000724 [Mycotypha africana]|uniref:uncharacterized protein n=1 Tax=Mycotypha africana TaxID=64632 RepID=UPI002301C106|nr:uncharacterized protein BDF20DRAFT_1000724 [Mycotypha africana]KAI8979398.1 hypothetical protein BDF20DRAFT_1000724 [Mycotypha africana]
MTIRRPMEDDAIIIDENPTPDEHMFSRIFSGIRSALNAPNAPRSAQQQSGRLSLEDSSEELVTRATKPIQIVPGTASYLQQDSLIVAPLFGLSNNSTDDFMQKDLITNSLY